MSLLKKIRTAEYYLKKCPVDVFYSIKYLAALRGQAPDFIQDVVKNELDLKSLFIELTFLCDVVGDNVCPLKDPYQIAAKYFQYMLMLKTGGHPYEMNRLFGHRHQAPFSVMEIIITTEDLKSLLLRYPQTFSIKDGTVALCKTLEELYRTELRQTTLDVLSAHFSSTSSSASITNSCSDSIVSGSSEPTVSDYVEEAFETAAEFFESIIRLKSGGMPYEISRLVGHRSQGPPEVYDIIANEADLTSLFLKYPTKFVVYHKTVSLCSSIVQGDISPSPAKEHLLFTDVHSTLRGHINDTDRKAADYFASILKKKAGGKPYEINRLVGHRAQAQAGICDGVVNAADLKALFLKHPKRFIVQDDTVLLVINSPVVHSTLGDNANDTNRKAADYFASILKKKSGGKPSEINCLIGHRAQAPPGVCVNVVNAADLKALFLKYPERFIVQDNKVLLVINSPVVHSTLGDNANDTDRKAADFFASVIKKKAGGKSYEINRLIGHRTQAPPGVCDNVVNAADLKALFLKYPERFIVQDNTVLLVINSPVVHSTLGDDANDTDRKAADFFASVLKKKAGGKPYEINRLVGHRTQAPPGVCDNVVNAADLKALFLKYPERFIVQDNTVLLVINSPVVHSTLGDDANDTDRKAADFFASVLKKKAGGKPYEINRLVGHRTQAPPGVCDNVVNAADLKALFLKYPERFIVQDNTVLLVINSPVVHSTLGDDANDTDRKAADFFASVLKKKAGGKPYEINRLVGHRTQAPPGVCDNIVKVADLKKLFLRHPKRFVIKDNTVSFSDSSVNNSSEKSNVNVKKEVHCLSGEQLRESYKKAADFFASILKLKSKGKPYPIKNLVGHRSQATPGVCDNVISCDNIRSLCLMFPERFVVTRKSVSLVTNFLNPAPSPKTSSDLQKLNGSFKEAANFYASIIMTKSDGMSYEIHRLLGHRSQAPPGVRDAVRNIADLTSLFLWFPDTFVVEGNTVSLISSNTEDTVKDTRREAEEYFSNILNNVSPFKILLIDELYREVRNAPDDIKQVCGESRAEFVKFLKQFPKSFVVTGENVFNHTTISHRKITDYNPIKHANILNSLYSVFEALTHNGKPNSIKTLFNEYASLSSEWTIKSIEELIEFLRIFPNTFYVLNETVLNLMCVSAKKATKRKSEIKALPPKIDFVTHVSTDWKESVLKQTEVVCDVLRCKEIVHNILLKEKVIGVDCEGFSLGWGGKITLLQISIQSGKVFIFDILTDGSMMSGGELALVLESPKILKVLHDCRNDSRNLISEFEIQLENVFDTQIAYYHLTKAKNSIGFNDMCLKYGVQLNTEKNAMRSIYKIHPDIWLTRPLSEDMIAYAAQDVACLFPPVFVEMLVGVSQTNFQRILTLSDIASKTHW